MARIAIYMTKEEYEWVVGEAGDIPLSKWCIKKLLSTKEATNGEGSGSRAVVVERGTKMDTGRGRKAEVAGRNAEPVEVDTSARRVGKRLDEVAAPAGVAAKSVDTTQNRCGNVLCGHKKWEHKKNYCTHGDCRCTAFMDAGN
jgi:hypothetical protein